MRKVIAAINMTLDGVCDHTAMKPDEVIHDHYTALLRSADVILYGRITYDLMLFWRQFTDHPSGEKSMNDFATAIEGIRKIVFSNTLKEVDWHSAELSRLSLPETVDLLRQKNGGDILVGSRSIINQLSNHGLIDEYQICVLPVIAGSGAPLFDHIDGIKNLEYIHSKTFPSGAVILYYKAVKN